MVGIGHRCRCDRERAELVVGRFQTMLKDWGERQKSVAPDFKDYHHLRDRILVVRGTSIQENSVEAIWERLAAR